MTVGEFYKDIFNGRTHLMEDDVITMSKLFAEIKCKEQRELCFKEVKKYIPINTIGMTEDGLERTCLNAKLEIKLQQ